MSILETSNISIPVKKCTIIVEPDNKEAVCKRFISKYVHYHAYFLCKRRYAKYSSN